MTEKRGGGQGSRDRGEARLRYTRRSLLKAGAVGAGAAGLPTTAAAAGPGDTPLTAWTLGVVASDPSTSSLEVDRVAGSRTIDVIDPDWAVEHFGEDVLAQPSGTRVNVPLSSPSDHWKQGHRVVLEEEYVERAWRIVGASHLYVPIDDQEVLARGASELRTHEGTLRLTPGSESAPAEWTMVESVPLEEIEPGDTVAGLGYVSPDGDAVEVAVLGLGNEDAS